MRFDSWHVFPNDFMANWVFALSLGSDSSCLWLVLWHWSHLTHFYPVILVLYCRGSCSKVNGKQATSAKHVKMWSDLSVKPLQLFYYKYSIKGRKISDFIIIPRLKPTIFYLILFWFHCSILWFLTSALQCGH